jgi:succinate dehydrogenase/fumarate reductase flavoprotein subunit
MAHSVQGERAVQAELEADVLVIGGGIAGLTAAARAAERGCNVILVEKAGEIGGSAVLSGGGLWTLAEPGLAAGIDEDCDAAMCETLVADFDKAIRWIESLGAGMLPPVRIDSIQGFPAICRPLDILGYIRLCAAGVTDAGGWIVTAATVLDLELTDGRVCGAVVSDRDGITRITAQRTILATGGYQANSELRGELIGPHARDLMLRSNPESDGGGIMLARRIGARLRDANAEFYGHLIAHPLSRPFTPPEYLRFSQVASPRTLLFNRQGQRFVDESISYYRNASAVARQPGGIALMVADEELRQYDLTAYPATESYDRFVEARAAGARVIEAATIGDLAHHARAIGFPGIGEGVAAFNTAIRSTGALVQPRRDHRRPLEPPFWAMEVSPAITFPFRGLLTDDEGRVMGENGLPIGCLFAVGADGCFYNKTYFGGLVLGLVFGLRAADALPRIPD